MATTWDPNNKAAGITLSGSNLIATAASGTNPGVYATRPLTGPSYWEVTATTIASTMGIGFASRSWNDASGTLLGGDANGLAFRNAGTVLLNNATLATIQTYTGGNVVQVAVNPQARLVWFNVNNGNWNNDVIGNQNPVGNIGGIDFSSMLFGALLPAFGASTTTGAGTAKFTASFTYTPPTGYLSVDTCAAAGIAAEITGSGATHDGPARQDPVTVFAQQTAFGNGYGPLAATKAISGTVTQNSSPAALIVRAYDHTTGELLGQTTSSAVDGTYSIPALGRKLVLVVAYDPTSYNALTFDIVVPV